MTSKVELDLESQVEVVVSETLWNTSVPVQVTRSCLLQSDRNMLIGNQ